MTVTKTEYDETNCHVTRTVMALTDIYYDSDCHEINLLSKKPHVTIMTVTIPIVTTLIVMEVDTIITYVMTATTSTS